MVARIAEQRFFRHRPLTGVILVLTFFPDSLALMHNVRGCRKNGARRWANQSAVM